MERVAVDEWSAADLHLWMSFMRLLLQVHPVVGADDYARIIGQRRPTDAGPGWNRIHRATGADAPIVYMLIPTHGAGGGRLTPTRPDVPENEIRDVYEDQAPAFESTAAYRTLVHLGDNLRKNPDVAPLIEEHWRVLHAAARAPLRAPDPLVNERLAKAWGEIRRGIASPGAGLATFETPLRLVVEDYLHFRLTRRHASNIAALLFAHLLVSIPSTDSASKFDVIKSQVDHLTDLASQICDERHRFDLGAFYTLTCLALLWAETAQILALSIAREAPADLTELIQLLGKKARFADEFAAHELAPSLSHPFLLVPVGFRNYLRSTTHGLPNLKCWYLGAGVTDARALNPEQIWPRIQQYSIAARSVPIPWETYVQLFSKELVRHLKMFLITVALGSAHRS